MLRTSILLCFGLASAALADESELSRVPQHCARTSAFMKQVKALIDRKNAAAITTTLPKLKLELTAIDDEHRSLAALFERCGVPPEASVDLDRDRKQAERRGRVPHFESLSKQFEDEACDTTAAFDLYNELEALQQELANDADDRASTEDAEKARYALAAKPAGPNATLEARQIDVDLRSETETLKMFQTASRDRFVFARKSLGQGILKGEALLVNSVDSHGVGVVSIDRQNPTINPLDVTLVPVPKTDVMPLKAERLSVSGRASGAVGGYEDLFDVETEGEALSGPPKFLLLAPDAPGVDAFLTRRQKTIECYDKVMGTLDPDGRRKHYDLVTGNRVESLNAVFDRKACASCNCKGLNVDQRALARVILTPLQTKELEKFSSTIERVRGLFGGR